MSCWKTIALCVTAVLMTATFAPAWAEEPCSSTPTNNTAARLLARGPMMFDIAEGGMKIAELGLIMDPAGAAAKEFKEYLQSIPRRHDMIFQVTLEPVGAEVPPVPSWAPTIWGTLTWDKDVEMYRLNYGLKDEKQIYVFTHSVCVAETLKARTGRVRLTIIAPSSTS